MILAKDYLTLNGCTKRCSANQLFSKTHNFHPVRFLDGAEDKFGAYDPLLDKAKRYTWRIEKVKRKAK